jgi:hypothetical protein
MKGQEKLDDTNAEAEVLEVSIVEGAPLCRGRFELV